MKKHKRLPPNARIGSLGTVIASIDGYLPYLLAVDAGVSSQCLEGGEVINVVLKTAPSISWRPTLSGDIVPGKERPRVKVTSLEYEIFFVLSSLAYAYTLTGRATLQPLYATTTNFLGVKERTTAITSATKHLLDAASIYDYLSLRSEQISSTAPCADVAPTTARALSSLALAEATLLAVLKDDPYPTAVAQDRNKSDKEWMFKAPDIPKVRAHLFARLCLAASEHAAKATSLLQSAGSGNSKVSPVLLKYLDDLRRTSRAKACRFFGIDAELGGQTAEGIGWLRVGLRELGVEVKDAKKGFSLSRFKKDISEKREDRRVEKETDWGSDAGRLEETRIIELLDDKWNKINDTVRLKSQHNFIVNCTLIFFFKMNTKAIPAFGTLIPKMPSGREIHTVKAYQPPTLDKDILEAMRSLPDREDDLGDDLSSDDDIKGAPSAPAGAFPGTLGDYGASRGGSGNAYY